MTTAMTILSASELAAKGISKRDVSGMLRRAENLCNWFAKKHRTYGVTEQEQREWKLRVNGGTI
jgi:hypothetical protein